MSVAPAQAPEQIDYSKMKSDPVDVAGPPLPPPSQFRDPMSRQLLEERMNPQPQLGTQTEKALTDRQLLDKYLSDKFMQEDIAVANAVSDKAQLYAGLGGAFNALNKGLTGFETDPNAYQLMHKGGMEAPSKVLAERQAMRENLLKKYGLGVQEKESEAKLAALKADQAYKQFDMQHKDKMFELEKAKVGTGTQQERKAANFLSEMVKADEDANKIRNEGYKREEDIVASAPQFGKSVAGWAGATDKKMSTNDQAEDRFVNALLRDESGASITPAERESTARQYFPRPGDSEEAIAQKARNRKEKIAAMAAEAGPLGARATAPTQSSQSQPQGQDEYVRVRQKSTGKTGRIRRSELTDKYEVL